MELLTLISEDADMALYMLYATLALGLFITALLGILNKFSFSRTIIAAMFVLSLGIGYLALGELLSRPKPVDIMTWERPDVEKARILGSYVVHGKAIYLLLIYEGVTVPRYYQYPWSKPMAEQLERGKRAQALEQIEGLELTLPFQRSLENRRHPEIHEIPWPAPPSKNEEERKQEIIDLDKFKLSRLPVQRSAS